MPDQTHKVTTTELYEHKELHTDVAEMQCRWCKLEDVVTSGNRLYDSQEAANELLIGLLDDWRLLRMRQYQKAVSCW